LHRSIGRNLVTGTQNDQVIEHDLGHSDLGGWLTVPNDLRMRGVEYGQSIQGSFGPQFLDDSDRRIRDDYQPEQAVLPTPGEEDHHDERDQNCVEDGENVGTNDLKNGSARSGIGGVCMPSGDPLSDVAGRQTAVRGADR
jgi:hypothetical protein